MLRCLVLLSCLILSAPVQAGRYEQYVRRVAERPGPPLKVVAASLFGSASDEAFVGGGVQPDGTVVLIGQSVGPEFPDVGVRVQTFGPDERGERVAPKPDKKGRVSNAVLVHPLRAKTAGFVLRWNPGQKKVVSASRFGFGVASAGGGGVAPNGDIYIVGRCDVERIRRLAAGGKLVVTDIGNPAPGFGDGYVARIDPSGTKLDWIHVLRGVGGTETRLLRITDDTVFVDLNGVRAISLDGRRASDLKVPGFSDRHGSAVSLDGKLVVHGGDRNTNTGREPYRNPYLHIYDGKGNRIETLWNWDSKRVGADQYRLVSDSSPRRQTFDPKGRLVVAGWSDGGNTVFTREPRDLDVVHGRFKGKFIDSVWGMNVGSLCTIMVIDPGTWQVLDGTFWTSFVPDDAETFGRAVGKPNNASIDSLGFLDDGSLAIAGTAATGLIETPDALFRYPGKGKFGGWYLGVLTADYRNLRFSTYLPDVEQVRVIPAGKRLLVVGLAKRDDDGNCAAPRVRDKSAFAGGKTDAWMLLLEDATAD